VNKRQLVLMWVGIAVILLFAFGTVVDVYRPDYAEFAVRVFLTVLVTGGLIYTFRNKKRQEVEKARKLNLGRGFRRITFVLAVIAAVLGVIVAVQATTDKHEGEKSKLNLPEFDKRLIPIDDNGNLIPSLDTMTQMNRDTWDKMSEEERTAAIQASKESKRKQLEESFWVSLSTRSLIGLCILAGLGGAVAGFTGVWFVYFLIWLVYLFIRWLVMGFYDINQKC
jgi:hypothetical protein